MSDWILIRAGNVQIYSNYSSFFFMRMGARNSKKWFNSICQRAQIRVWMINGQSWSYKYQYNGRSESYRKKHSLEKLCSLCYGHSEFHLYSFFTRGRLFPILRYKSNFDQRSVFSTAKFLFELLEFKLSLIEWRYLSFHGLYRLESHLHQLSSFSNPWQFHPQLQLHLLHFSGNTCESFSKRIITNDSNFPKIENSTNLDAQKYKHLWVQCENCYAYYKKLLKSKMGICEQCGYHSSSDRIELLDPGTWNPMDEGMVSMDPIEFHSEEEAYKDRIDSYQKTGSEAVQTGSQHGIPAIGVMDFQFMGGSMGSGEKITRFEYAANKFPLIICASGGARMQEGSCLQMAKISSVLYDYQSNKKLFYVSILTSPTTGGAASFGMLGDIIIAEPNAYIAFAGKRVEQTYKTVPEGSQAAEFLFHKGLFQSYP
uniref:Acetyl-CoA carboxylase beta subunit n=1 Tax=Chenopodium album TaxID=3559 RepID=A0A291S7Y8_CHEAL|nr:acetyl-CoA carboxylase beta subunit [Chenopodium album]